MQRYDVSEYGAYMNESAKGAYYFAEDVDAEIERLREMLKVATYDDSLPEHLRLNARKVADLYLQTYQEATRQKNEVERLRSQMHDIAKSHNDLMVEVVRLRQQLAATEELVSHCWVHSGYQDCGSQQMTTEQRALYQAIIDRTSDEPTKGPDK